MGSGKIPTINVLSAGAVVYTISDNRIMVLLLEQSNEFYKRTGRNAGKRIVDVGPCGRLEPGENLIKAARRELKQEANLDIPIDRSFKYWFSYTFDGIAERGRLKGKRVHIRKRRVYFMARASKEDVKKVKVSEEHTRYIWMPIDEAIKSHILEQTKRNLLKRLKARLSQITNYNSATQ